MKFGYRTCPPLNRFHWFTTVQVIHQSSVVYLVVVVSAIQ